MNGRKRPMSLFVILIILRKLLNRVAFIQMDRFIFDCGAKFETKFFSTSRKPRLTYPKVAVYRLGC